MSLTNSLKKIADNQTPNSLSTRLRKKRFVFFKSLLDKVPRPITILDIGGTEVFWKTMEFTPADDVKIILLNLSHIQTTQPNFESLVGDARDLSRFNDRQFDVVFSNSVIEHVGEFSDQCKMASEVRRVGKRYFIQTPNRYFPIEPHFLLPLFQFYPLFLKVFLMRHFNLGWYKKIVHKQTAIQAVTSIRLLTEGELRKLFPEANIYKEKFFGLTKSFIAYNGWD